MISQAKLNELHQAHGWNLLILDDGETCRAFGPDATAVQAACEASEVVWTRDPKAKDAKDEPPLCFPRASLPAVLGALHKAGCNPVVCGWPVEEAAKKAEPVVPVAAPVVEEPTTTLHGEWTADAPKAKSKESKR